VTPGKEQTMARILRRTWGVQIHPRTGQELSEGWIEPRDDVEVPPLGLSRAVDPFGTGTTTVIVEGFVYRVAAADVAE
jgi:hypothetical protein